MRGYMREVKAGQIYKHFKGNLYQIVAVAKHSETQEDYVVYQALYGDLGVWVRPYEMFVSEVDREKYPDVTAKYRFELLRTMVNGGAEVKTVTTQPAESSQSVESVQSAELSQPAESLQPAETSQSEVFSEEKVDQRLLDFLELDTVQQKIDYLTFNQKNIDDRLIDDIAVAMDLVIEKGPIDARFLSLKKSLMFKAKYECARR